MSLDVGIGGDILSISAILSIIFGFGSMFVGYMLPGGHLGALVNTSSLIIVFGGTIGAVALSFPPSILKKLPGILKVTFTNSKHKDMGELIRYFKDISVKTRKDGLLSIEETISSDPTIDPFIKKGLQLVVDGVEPQTVRDVLEAESYMVSERHKSGASIFETAGGYAPTMGIIGTVMHLVEIMGSLSGNPDELGPKIGAAFLAGTPPSITLPLPLPITLCPAPLPSATFRDCASCSYFLVST